MTLDFLLAAGLGYLLGSLPSAYLLVRWKSRKDIRRSGSGNVGALNSYLVTRSRFVGAAVLLIDLLKGMAAVVAANLLFGGGFAEGAMAGIASVVGHNFSVWLNFKGGRGLATAAGAVLVLAWPIVPFWMLLWGIGYLLARNVNVGNAIATLLLFVAMLAVPSWVLERLVAEGGPVGDLRFSMALMFFIILIKHIEPVREFFRERRGAVGSAEAETEAKRENP
ncbi:glycerol-3-phosphate acyltransferase [bacterium]|nr:MAG: glycerol-3-phosphate acyltransferase [bacterium]